MFLLNVLQNQSNANNSTQLNTKIFNMKKNFFLAINVVIDKSWLSF